MPGQPESRRERWAGLTVIGALLLGLAIFLADYRDPAPVVHTPDGGLYQGGLIEGRFAGQGSIRWADGSSYAGNFQAGYFQGKGKRVFADGVEYEGDFVRGLAQGTGKFLFPAGDRYEGQVKNGLYHGHGVFIQADGARWEGEFHHHEPVRGSFHPAKNKGHYEGEFNHWALHGQGMKVDDAGNRYLGRFAEGALSGEGEYIGKDGSHYQGAFRKNQFHGQGIFRSAEGDTYQGRFAWGDYHGAGVLTLAEKIDGVTEYRGRWERGVLVESDSGVGAYQEEEAVEALLYRQVDLLDEQLRGLQQDDPDETQLYYLGIAGDGNQEVFRREVLYARELFAERFGSRKRSLVLINSRQTHERFPLATQTSLRRALQGLAQRMDREHDILFVFLSSHGSKAHRAYLQQPGLSLPDLGADELGEMIGELGIQHKVVVVSTCYSGGFIPALDDGRTLVFTAASADKPSFGCADRNQFTYFGRAYFKESLAQGLDFVAAFDNARNLVGGWEKHTGEEASEPRQLVPQQAVAYLTDWFARQRLATVRR